MKKATVLLTILTLAILGISYALAEEDPIQNAIDGCKSEIEAYCSQVSPGDGRLLACFYAHEDKLSGRCNWALYESAAQLEQFAVAITHLADQCWDDLVKHCAEVEMGEGRVGTCLLKHKAEVSKGCSQAIDDVELEVDDG
jgi:hypothetical protein